jgi:hypothetical protein
MRHYGTHAAHVGVAGPSGAIEIEESANAAHNLEIFSGS